MREKKQYKNLFLYYYIYILIHNLKIILYIEFSIIFHKLFNKSSSFDGLS